MIDPKTSTAISSETYTLRLRIHKQYYSHNVAGGNGDYRLYEKADPSVYTTVPHVVYQYFDKWASERYVRPKITREQLNEIRADQKEKALQLIFEQGFERRSTAVEQ